MPCRLTDVELRERWRQHGVLEIEIEAIEAELEGTKSHQKSLAAKAEEREAERRSLSRICRAEAEDRQVDVEVRLELRTGTVTEVRTDTGEVLHERAATMDERQGVMFAEAAAAAPADEEPAEKDVTPKALPPRKRAKGEDREEA